ncbi:MAG: putative arabinose efflux permease, MFS family [Chloroflexi bacterium]|nr:MAG: putative arabinose efflux permease, MFS family [Chloroflexota bacterium]
MDIGSKLWGFQGVRSEYRAAGMFYFTAVMYAITFSMMTLLVPLYALHLGFDFKTMGAIVSAQAIFQLGLRLFGGVLSDRFGERPILWVSFLSPLVGAIVFAYSASIWTLVGAQVFIGISRAVYWNASQSYASRMSEGNAGGILGRFLGYGSAGLIIGSLLAGAVAASVSFKAAFLVTGVLCAAGLLVSLAMPGLPRKGALRTLKQIIEPLPGLLTSRMLLLGMLLAFMSSMSSALLGSTFPALLKEEFGYDETAIGIYRALYSSALLIMGFAFAGMLKRYGQKAIFALCIFGMAAFTMLTPLSGSFVVPLGIVTFILGAAFGISRIFYPVIAAENSVPAQRGMAMSVVGLGWALGMLVVPVVFGTIADLIGLSESTYVAGVVFLVVALGTPLFYRWVGGARKAPEEVASGGD